MTVNGARTAVEPNLLSVLLQTLAAFQQGDRRARAPGGWTGPEGELAVALNRVLDHCSRDCQPELPATLAEELGKANAQLQAKNEEIERSRKALEEKAAQLAQASRYKSEFLANMSHELRTPLNNLLILARILSENSDGNLTPKQVKFAQTIYTSGNDLLGLINDILDLSKIESGKMQVDPAMVRFAEIQDFCLNTFHHVAEGKHLEFTVELEGLQPAESIHTDGRRLQQVLKNLLSNALKFTERGAVRLVIGHAEQGWSPQHPILAQAGAAITFSVSDTGVGIEPDKQHIIFEAFQQADGTTSRKYGGTGLGLSISRELVHLLGGEIRLRSTPGEGSTFTLYLPQTYAGSAATPELDGSEITKTCAADAAGAATIPENPGDDRDSIAAGDAVVLIGAQDAVFVRELMEQVHGRQMKALVAPRDALVVSLTRQFRPAAVVLDVDLPQRAGWVVLDRLKHDPLIRHIPVHVVSDSADPRRVFAMGASSCIGKSAAAQTCAALAVPEAPHVKKLLLVCRSLGLSAHIESTLAAPDVSISRVGTRAEAVAWMRDFHFDGIVTDQVLGEAATWPPVLMLSGTRPTHENPRMRRAPSLERLLEESVLLFHRDEADLGAEQRRILDQLRETEPTLCGKTVLVVDDDVRNIFALTSLLEDYGLRVLHAETGIAGLAILQNSPEIDAVLMDIMIPEMDGYATMTAIRQLQEFSDLPLIALSAKTSYEDRVKCIDAGASDCMTKPIDLEQLFSVLRVWVGTSRAFPAIRTHVSA